MSLAFVTGSQIYGVPDGDSDIDLVIRTSEKHAKMLLMMSDFPEEYCDRFIVAKIRRFELDCLLH